jgi:hypothetical protein
MLALALSSSGWTAIGAVGGALVGASAGGIVTAALEWRRERSLMRAGARLIASDIWQADAVLRGIEEGGKWHPSMPLAMDSWDDYKTTLAARLDSSSYTAVAQFVISSRRLDVMTEGIRSEAGQAPIDFNSEMLERIGLARDRAAKAYNALSRIAGHGHVDDYVLGPPIPKPDARPKQATDSDPS